VEAAFGRLAAFDPFDELPERSKAIRYVAFLQQRPDGDRHVALMKCASEVDHLHVHENHVFWRRRTDAGESLMSGSRIERALRMPTTVRNVSTIHAMVEKYGLR